MKKNYSLNISSLCFLLAFTISRGFSANRLDLSDTLNGNEEQKEVLKNKVCDELHDLVNKLKSIIKVTKDHISSEIESREKEEEKLGKDSQANHLEGNNPNDKKEKNNSEEYEDYSRISETFRELESEIETFEKFSNLIRRELKRY